MKFRPQMQLRFRDEKQYEMMKGLAAKAQTSLNEYILQRLEARPQVETTSVPRSGRGVDGARARRGAGGRGESDSTIGLPPTSPINSDDPPEPAETA